jgi:hypothetical protein
MWIFKDSIKNDIDTISSYSQVNRRDVYTNFHYKEDYNVLIWEFKDLGNTDLAKIVINQNVKLSDIKFFSGEILNKNSDMEITVNYGFSFMYDMSLNLDKSSTIERTFEMHNYKGFYGTINQMSLSDEQGKHQILFNYRLGKEPSVLILYKGHKSFFLIIINSEKPFDESIINILNID